MPVAETRAWLDKAAAAIEIAVSPARRAEAAPPSIVPRQGTVLVVDDEPQILRALRVNLTARSYDVITAATAHAALDAAAHHQDHGASLRGDGSHRRLGEMVRNPL